MKRLIAILSLLALALPAGAEGCVEGGISWDNGTPLWNPTAEIESLNTAINGTFLWVQPQPEVEDIDGVIGTVSYEIPPGTVGAVICAVDQVLFIPASDGSPQPDAGPIPEPVVASSPAPLLRFSGPR